MHDNVSWLQAVNYFTSTDACDGVGFCKNKLNTLPFRYCQALTRYGEQRLDGVFYGRNMSIKIGLLGYISHYKVVEDA